ncbi:hypothetical protein PPL_09647 [Heterostelium album PN500]|uniref:Uncharacterized protein n=1 Tax=Heterostelium pallidum (strain ATCC 26659 / Pp 5 / PN500) TaxID=670386 RepID=D3BNX6_HETP5|nr:hypothetical protein PPL_09647 [Heterostelium album PN500]EFA76895.1 hypothetical protein PPL_09647 [Heterostelium album PN500]|eukprot:XP_020429027.1 hypothetical protein PPL_09647 [Heterostelium album PN500]
MLIAKHYDRGINKNEIVFLDSMRGEMLLNYTVMYRGDSDKDKELEVDYSSIENEKCSPNFYNDQSVVVTEAVVVAAVIVSSGSNRIGNAWIIH